MAAEVEPVGPNVPAAQAAPEHVALAAEVDLAGPYVPAAHAAPEHVEAPAVGRHRYHIWSKKKTERMYVY